MKSIEELKEYIEILEAENKELSRRRTEESNEYYSLQQEYEKIIEEKDQELMKLRGKIISQEITLASYKDKTGIPLIVEGEEKDLYKGEQKDFIIKLIQTSIDTYDKYSRSYKICQSILNANKPIGTREELKKALQNIFKNYMGMDRDTSVKLQALGIRAELDGRNHYRLTLFDDERYTVNVSNTPSDERCGKNIFGDINRIIF